MRFILSLIILFFSNICFSQFKQLVKDSSFEINNKLWNAKIYNSRDSFNYRSVFWKSPTDGTSDLFSFDYVTDGQLKLNQIIYSTFIDTLYNIKNDTFELNPHKGRCLGAIGLFSTGYHLNNGLNYKYMREFIQTELNTNLIKNRKYNVSAYIISAWHNIYSFDTSLQKKHNVPLSMYFSEDKIENVIHNCYRFPDCGNFKKQYNPQVKIKDISFQNIYNLNWEHKTKLFKSNNNAQFMTIGVFEKDDDLENARENARMLHRYFYLDDITVTEIPCLVAPDSVCYNSNTKLYATLGMPYYWSFSKNGNDTLSKDSIFNFVGTQSQWIYCFGKYGIDSAFITVMPSLPNHFPKDTFHFCKNIQNQYLLNGNFGSQYQYLWDNGETSPQSLVTQSGKYKLQITDSLGCSNTISTNLNIINLPNIYLPQDTIICFQKNGNLLLNLNTNYDCYWMPLNINNCDIEIKTPGKYTLQLKDKNNCIDSFKINIHDNCELKVFVPSVFSPLSAINSNQNFAPFVSYYSKYKMTIYNRWGERIFETNDVETTWDGTYMNEPCEQGTYLCMIEVTDLTNNETKFLRQVFQLLR